MKMIVLINQSAGHITDDIVLSLSKRFHVVVTIAGATCRLTSLKCRNVKMERIIPYKRHNTLMRLLTWLIGSLQILYLIIAKYPGAYLLFTSNPPFAPLLALLFRNRFSVLVYDIYPDVLIQHKLFNADGIVVKWWQAANRLLFGKAEHVFVLSMGMKSVIMAYASAAKVKSATLWYNDRAIRNVPKTENAFIAKHGLHGKFVVLYSGNIGYTHDVDVMTELAAANYPSPDIRFIIIGDGDQRKKIERIIEQRKLTNCMVLDYQPLEMFPHSLSAADLALVTLGQETSHLSVPSKTFNLIGVGAPIIGVADASSELARIINAHKLGKCFSREQVPEMVDYIRQMMSDRQPLERLRMNCRKASRLFSTANANLFSTYIT